MERVEKAGWEKNLPDVDARLRGFLQRHIPLLGSHHDDLVNDTFEGLVLWLRDKPDIAEKDLLPIATVILKRRIADLFRKRLARLGNDSPADDSAVDRGAEVREDIEQTTDMRIISRATLELIDALPKSDADLLMLRTTGPLNGRDRQRLRRVRQHLSRALEKRLGITVEEILRRGAGGTGR
jgi:DNA-directed RNA polymerase specialized sigma24 family protein